MTKVILVVTVALSLLNGIPASAKAQGDHIRYGGHPHRLSAVERAQHFGYRSAYDAYGSDGGGNFARGNADGDFDRRNTFN